MVLSDHISIQSTRTKNHCHLFHSNQAKDETDLLILMGNLKRDQVAHKIWIEEPYKIATCLALKPYPEMYIPDYIKDLKLFE